MLGFLPLGAPLIGLLESLDFSVDVPGCFGEVFDCVAFGSCSPDVFDGVAEVEAHVFGYLDAFYAAWVVFVVVWVDG